MSRSQSRKYAGRRRKSLEGKRGRRLSEQSVERRNKSVENAVEESAIY